MSQPDQLRILIPTPAASAAVCTFAQREGFFARQGLDASIEIVGNSTSLLRGIEPGGAFVAYLAAAAILEAALDGADLVLFAGAVNKPFHSIVCRPDISSAGELRGKRVGFNGRNEELSCRLALAQLGLRMPEDVTPVHVPGLPESRLAALREGTVEATAVSPPITFRARKEGFRELVSLADFDGDYQSGSCATSRRFLAERRDVIVRFTRGLIDAIRAYKTDHDRALAALAAHTGGRDPEELEDSWRIFARRCMPDVPALTLPGLRFVLDNVVQHPAAAGRDARDLVDLSVVREALA